MRLTSATDENVISLNPVEERGKAHYPYRSSKKQHINIANTISKASIRN